MGFDERDDEAKVREHAEHDTEGAAAARARASCVNDCTLDRSIVRLGVYGLTGSETRRLTSDLGRFVPALLGSLSLSFPLIVDLLTVRT